MTASEVREAGGSVSKTVIDAAAELATKAQDSASAALAGALVVSSAAVSITVLDALLLA